MENMSNILEKDTKQTGIPSIVLSVYFISLAYWVFRFNTSFSSDLIDYQALGRILQHQGMTGYLMTGPHREPLYPLICAWAMNIENLTGISFTHVMAGLGILMLVTTQILMYTILKKLNVNTLICSLVILYWGLSPAINYSAFNVLLFCEIVTYPFILALVLVGCHGWEAVKQNNKILACSYGALTGLIFAVLTFVKAAFECICPAYLILLLIASFYRRKISFSLICFFTTAGILFYIPITGYKYLNKLYNGSFAMADRGPENFYGNVERRTEPLTLRKFLADIATVGGVCEVYFKPDECYFWTYNESDGLGYQKSVELTNQHLSPQAVTDAMLRISKEKVLKNFPQYSLLSVTESFKMYFWEAATKHIPLNGIAALLTFFSFVYGCFYFKNFPGLMRHAVLIIILFVFFYSFFAILPRHILPIVPLYLICIGYSFSQLLGKV